MGPLARFEMTPDKLIVFVKAPRAGGVKSRLARTIGAEQAARAYRELVETMLHNLSAQPEVELCYTPEDSLAEVRPWANNGWIIAAQTTGDLGERMHTAFVRAFNEGRQRVVIIGSDCPEITLNDIQEAWTALVHKDVVLGPASDGGYWLIGLRHAQPGLFREMVWSTNRVFAETVERAQHFGLSVHRLRELTDVDTEVEWRTFLASRSAAGDGSNAVQNHR